MPSSNYTGSSYPSPGNDAPSPAPAPGSQIIIIVPADDTPNTAANLYIQQYKTLADYVNAIQSAIRPSAPVAYGAAIGFSTVTQVGGGTGTVTPSGTAYGGQNVVINMIAGGAVGTATFQYSLDGGATYSVTSNTVPTFSLGSSGISVAFAGTFSAATTYQFKAVFTPAIRVTDPSAKGRFVLDHNGIDAGGRMLRIDEAYKAAIAAGATTDPLASVPHLRFSRIGTTFNYELGVAASGDWSGASLNIYTGANAANDAGYVGQDNFVYAPGSMANAISVFEWEVSPSAVGASGMDIWCGWASARRISSANERVAFKLPSGGGSVWNIVTATGGVATTTATTVTGATGWTRLRIETHGASTPLGTIAGARVALFFINETFVGAQTTNMAASSILPSFGVEAPTPTLNKSCSFSPYSIRVLRTPDVVL